MKEYGTGGVRCAEESILRCEIKLPYTLIQLNQCRVNGKKQFIFRNSERHVNFDRCRGAYAVGCWANHRLDTDNGATVWSSDDWITDVKLR